MGLGKGCKMMELSNVEETKEEGEDGGEKAKRTCRLWKRGVIVEMLGRKIGFKALESHLKHMWVRRVIDI
ncbi:hypothetical protein TSUD_67880 [Trifolium subterraneum]|uniref:DUF4283 domain-containing protein n=1 Tax=Trifolium subterraneum TaxID=3900 RepID=A0A2Z6MC32_TRISU|nr:hypothetical protein TSUD_67880 [Trifolium subterraneum]